jgi:hypothetical protein
VYGRAWGALLYFLLYFLAAFMLFMCFFQLLHLVGIFAWAVRMLGGLFVDRASWGASFRQSFHGSHYGMMLAGIILTAAGYLVIGGISVELAKLLGVVGVVLYFLIDLRLSVAPPVWLFALYHAERQS